MSFSLQLRTAIAGLGQLKSKRVCTVQTGNMTKISGGMCLLKMCFGAFTVLTTGLHMIDQWCIQVHDRLISVEFSDRSEVMSVQQGQSQWNCVL